jgi:hypothetical protein
MYRIVREENRLTGKIQFIIERKKKWLWMESWTKDLGLDINISGPVGAPTKSGAQFKLQEIIAWDGRVIKRDSV